MIYIQILIGIIGLARELLKFFKESETDKIKRSMQITEFKHAVRRARKEGVTDDIEKAFSNLNFGVNKSKSN